MSNAGLKLREPVIGDELDLQTYGRPSAKKDAGQRESKVSQDRVVRAGAPRARRQTAEPARKPRQATRPAYDSGRTRIDADGVRTVKIRGQATPARRRTHSIYERPIARYDQHPDRAAQWALFLGVFMVVVAIVTGT